MGASSAWARPAEALPAEAPELQPWVPAWARISAPVPRPWVLASGLEPVGASSAWARPAEAPELQPWVPAWVPAWVRVSVPRLWVRAWAPVGASSAWAPELQPWVPVWARPAEARAWAPVGASSAWAPRPWGPVPAPAQVPEAVQRVAESPVEGAPRAAEPEEAAVAWPRPPPVAVASGPGEVPLGRRYRRPGADGRRRHGLWRPGRMTGIPEVLVHKEQVPRARRERVASNVASVASTGLLIADLSPDHRPADQA